MKTVTVTQKRTDRSYPIHIGSGTMAHVRHIPVVRDALSVCIITDDVVASHWLAALQKSLANQKGVVISIPSGEQNKTIRTLMTIWRKMLKAGIDRSSVIITLGGGVVSDIGGFAAATYMRGIPVVHIPTTLLAQVDASIGGKTAIDFNGVKNSVGVFYPPSAVIIDVQTLHTLPARERISGWAEIIKHAVIADKKWFADIDGGSLQTIDDGTLIEIITRSLRIKKDVVERDEEEKLGIRKQLNFGHTVGHAIESLSMRSKSPLLHGEAVAIGMVAETRMSRDMGMISTSEEESIVSLIRSAGLPTRCALGNLSQILSLMEKDKKNVKKVPHFSLPISIGSVESDKIVEPNIIKASLLSVISSQ
ncbi:MAG: 3-dehydroquinate synthase [Candidatus Roizmanbacteria bacterium]